MAAAGLVLTGCGPGDDEECADAYERAIQSIDGVTSVEITCGESFGNTSDQGTATLDADTQAEANPIIEEIYRSLARSPDMLDTNVLYIDFDSDSGGPWFTSDDLGLDRYPSVGEVREKYGITPTPTP